MDNLRNIYDPFFIVKCNGVAIPTYLNERIIKFEFDDDYKKDDIFTILLDNRDLSITDDTNLNIGKIISCRFGYLNRYTDFIDAVIKDIEGFTEIKITAYSIGKGYNIVNIQDTQSAPENVAENREYYVREGDTLNKIALMFSLQDWNVLYQNNKEVIGKNPNKIEPGMRLMIPNFKSFFSSKNISATNTSNVLGVKSRVWKNMTYSQVAKTIATSMGLIANVTETKQAYDSIPQSNETNFNFLKRLATSIGFYVKISNKLLTFAKRDYSIQSNYSLTYYIDGAGELIKFSPKVKTKNSTSAASSTSLSAKEKATLNMDSYQTNTTKLSKYSYSVNGITGETKKILTPNKNLSNNKISEDNEDHSGVAMEDAEDGSVTADCECIGIPEITANKIITLHGVGKRWGGNWYVSKTTHTIDNSGYSTKIDLSRNALGEAAAPVSGTKNESKPNTSNTSNTSNKGSYYEVNGITGATTKKTR